MNKLNSHNWNIFTLLFKHLYIHILYIHISYIHISYIIHTLLIYSPLYIHSFIQALVQKVIIKWTHAKFDKRFKKINKKERQNENSLTNVSIDSFQRD